MQVCNPPPKMVSFSQLASVKKTPFSVQLENFLPLLILSALLDLDSVHNARKLLNINLLSHFRQFLNSNLRYTVLMYTHGLRTPREEIAFTARPKIQSQSQFFKYGGSIFCLPHGPNFSDIFDLCLHWVSVDRDFGHSNFNNSQIKIGTELIYHISVFPSVLFSESSNSQT